MTEFRTGSASIKSRDLFNLLYISCKLLYFYTNNKIPPPVNNLALETPQENRVSPHGLAGTLNSLVLDGTKRMLLAGKHFFLAFASMLGLAPFTVSPHATLPCPQPRQAPSLAIPHPLAVRSYVGNCNIETELCHVMMLPETVLTKLTAHIHREKHSTDFVCVGVIEGLTDTFHVCVMYHEMWDLVNNYLWRIDCAPHSQAHAPGDYSSQNVRFLDETSGNVDGDSVPYDEVRRVTQISDTHLGNFLERPVQIDHIVLAPGATLDRAYFPWDDFIRKPAILNKVRNFRLLQGKLKLKFVINGSPFHYGRIIASYTPMAGFDSFTRPIRTGVMQDIIGLSQRPHVYLDPTDSMGGMITCPFLWNKNSLSLIGNDDLLDMGGLTLKTLNLIKHANGATDPITISIYAWMEDVEMSVPTSFDPNTAVGPAMEAFSVRPHAEEYSTGPVSRPASVVANIASKLTSIPTIAPFARATELGASALASIASLFGFSRPIMIKTEIVRPTAKNSISTMNQDDDAHKLSLDVKQELSVDPRLFGMNDTDEMSISHIAGVESYLTSFEFKVSDTADALLWNSLVDPCIFDTFGAAPNTEVHMPAMCFASLPFNKWRGTLKYRFQIVASKYHRGRIKVVWDPWSIYNDADVNLTTAYNTIVDLRDTTDFTFEVGWGQSEMFRGLSPLDNPPELTYGTTPIDYLPNLDAYGNGVLSVYVVTELAVPDTTVNNDIQINVFVSASDDFELAEPSGERVANLRLTSPNYQPTAVMSDDVVFKTMSDEKKHAMPFSVAPHAMAEDTGATQDSQENASEQNTTVKVGPSLSIGDKTNLIHYGESIRSFRQLLKRYSLHEIVTVARDGQPIANPNNIFHKISRNILPFEPGFSNRYNTNATTPLYVLTDGRYAYGEMTPIRYLTTAFVGWKGGVRWMINGSTLGCPCDRTDVLAARAAPCSMENEYSNDQNGGHSLALLNSEYSFKKDFTMQEGGVVTSLQVNPVVSIEVPYYSNYRFAPGRLAADFRSTESYPWMPGWKFGIMAKTPDPALNPNDWASFPYRSYSTYVAAAEDFQVSGFIGAPPFYIEYTRPT